MSHLPPTTAGLISAICLKSKGNAGHAAVCAPQSLFLQHYDGGDRQALDEGRYEEYKKQKLEGMAAGPKD